MRALLVTLAVLFSVAASRTKAAELSIKERQDARKLYNAKCAKCHKFYDPAEYSQVDWNVWMSKMSRKSKLKPEQHELLSRYLETFRTSEKSALKK